MMVIYDHSDSCDDCIDGYGNNNFSLLRLAASIQATLELYFGETTADEDIQSL